LGFVAMTEAIVVSIQVISIVVIVIIMIVLANTMAMTARERSGEYAILKTLGFGPGYILWLIAGESLVIALSGGMLGIILTFPTVQVVGKPLATFFPVFIVTAKTLWLAIGASLLVGLAAAIFPVWRASTIRIADGLRGIG